MGRALGPFYRNQYDLFRFFRNQHLAQQEHLLLSTSQTFPLFVWLATTVLLLPIVQILSPSFFGFAAWRELLALFPLKPLDAKWVCVVLLMISNLSGLALVVISIIKGGKDALLLGFCGGLVGIYALMFLRFALEVGIGVGFSCCCGLHWKWELGRRGPVVPHPETIGSFDGNHYADFLNVRVITDYVLLFMRLRVGGGRRGRHLWWMGSSGE